MGLVTSRRTQPELPDTDAGHETRLRRANERANLVLGTALASKAEVTSMGTQFKILLDARGSPSSFSFPTVDEQEALGFLAMRARPFTLAREEIYFEKVANSLRRFARTDAHRIISDQLHDLRNHCGKPRMRLFTAQVNVGDLIPGGTTDAEVADRVLYSQLVHADDASELLQHVDTTMQQWALAGMVGDWVALISQQQWVTHLIRPDICPQPATWAGTPRTIFERLGGQVEDI